MTLGGCVHPRPAKVIELFGMRREIATACVHGCDDHDPLRESTLQSLASSVARCCSVPDRFREAVLDASTPLAIRDAVSAAIAALPDFRLRWGEPNLREAIPRIAIHGRGFGIFGTNGVGKSHVMGAFLRGARERLVPGVMVAASQLQLELERAQRFDSPASGSEVVDRYSRAALLVLDDLDKLVASTSTIAVSVFELIDARSRENRPLFVTTNIAPSELAAVIFGRHDRHAVGADDRWYDMIDWVQYPGLTTRRGVR